MEPIARCRFLKLLVAPALAFALAACSTPSSAGVATLSEVDKSGGESAAEEQKDAEAELVKWAECMRENGIDIPDPTADGEGNLRMVRPAQRATGGSDEAPSGAVRVGEEFQKAREECGDPPRIPGAGPSEEDLKELQENALALSQCMRDEGIEDFPDPDFSGSGPGAGVRVTVGGPLGGVDREDPEVQAALEACREKLPEGPFQMGRAERPAN
jgi:hypothetical protein